MNCLTCDVKFYGIKMNVREVDEMLERFKAPHFAATFTNLFFTPMTSLSEHSERPSPPPRADR